MRTSVRRTNLTLAITSASIGLLAFVLTLFQGGGLVGYVLAGVLLTNGYVRYRMVGRE